MRHHQVVGISAIRKDTEATHGAAEVFLAALTWAAGAAADPWMRESTIANLDACGVGAEGNDFADVFVAQRNREFHTAIGKTHSLTAAQVKPAVGEVQIAVADAGSQDF